LSDDYTLVRINSDDISIFLDYDKREIDVQVYIRDKTKPEEWTRSVAVPTKIVSYGQEGHIVFGEIKKVLGSYDFYKKYSEDVSGFFVLDMNEHKCILGLDKANLDKKLAEYGIRDAKMRRTKWQ
jgi:hypothetical protein